MCLVEIEGARGLQTSCTTPVREGLVVKVHTSPAAVKARKANIEFLLTNHPLDCPVCDKGGECPLQNQAMLDGPGQSRYIEEKRHKAKRLPLGDLIVIDQERCVLCWRCIRFLDEWAGNHQLDLFGRGASTRLETFPDRPLTSKWQGNTIDICPVGALTSRIFRFEARVWELTETDSVCPLCSVGCNIVLGVKNNKLRRITPRENLEVNDTWICDKGRFCHGFVDHPDRLRTPLLRRDGQLQEASWDEAFDLIAKRFRQAIQEKGPQALAALGSTRATNEANYLFQRFMRTVVGSNNVDHLGRLPAGVDLLHSLPDLEHKDVIVLLGCDPSTETPLVELWLKKAILRHGAQIVVANPRQTELCQYAATWLGYRPGSEVGLLNGLERLILHAQPESSPSRTRATNLEEFETWLQAYGPGQIETLSGVPAKALRRAAEVLGQARRVVILYGPDWVGHRATREKIAAIANLGVLLGEVDIAYLPQDNNTVGALEMGVVPDLFPGHQPFQDTKVRGRLASFWGSKVSPVAGLDFDQMIAQAQEGRLQAMWIMGADPAQEWQAARKALDTIPFLVVQDLFMSETAQIADVILPAASFVEVEGSYFNLTGRLQALEPGKRPPGEAQPDWWIILQLARKMSDPGQRRAWELAGPHDILDEISKVLPGYRGITYAKIGKRGWQRPREQETRRRAFVRVEPEPPPHNAAYPLTLVTGKLLYDQGTLLRHSEPTSKLAPPAALLVHPSDAQEVGINDGEVVSLESSDGKVALTAVVTDEIVRGVVFVPRNVSDTSLSVLFGDRSTLPHVRLTK
jgi:NADH-quinone oxidoreductase chain G